MTICVTGMHRSGTSMVMSVLYGLGLHVGDLADLMPANASNPDGHWEHVPLVELSDAALAVLGGGWDLPPAALDGSRPTALCELQRRAFTISAAFDGAPQWGWKDPRVSLLLPFWFGVFPDLRLIVCLRNPLDAAQSLRCRGYSSCALGLSLWQAYNERIVAASRPEQRLVVHYQSFFERPEDQLRRLCAFAGLAPASDALRDAACHIKPARCHHVSSLTDLRAAGVHPDRVDLYLRLCEEAEWREPA